MEFWAWNLFGLVNDWKAIIDVVNRNAVNKFGRFSEN